MQCASEKVQDISSSAGITQMENSQCKNTFDSSYLYKPRGALAKTIYYKQLSDRYISQIDRSTWYNCDLKHIPPSVAAKFVQLDHDKESMKFVQESEEKSDWILLQIWHIFVRSILSWFMTQTSINGYWIITILTVANLFAIIRTQKQLLMRLHMQLLFIICLPENVPEMAVA